MTQRETRITPDKDTINQLPPFGLLDRARIEVVQTAAEARAAAQVLRTDPWWGFDTESRPVFVRDQASDGPHVVQLATTERAFVFLLHDAECQLRVAELLAEPAHRKAGFGLRDDQLRIRARLGVEAAGVLELNSVFRERGYRKDMGVKAAVAVLFGQRFAKSKKAATSNWAARTLSESQILYAANDAWAARLVAQALGF